VLSDPEKRQVFDEAGIVDDGADGDGGGGGGEGVWEDYFRHMFPAGERPFFFSNYPLR
jgi:DnaJ-class molecular chaperone